MKHIVVGSRESRLAVVQTEEVVRYLRLACPDTDVSILTMKTTGDKILDRRLDQIGGKGLFVKELDRALAEKKTDLSVHSLKDLPMEIPEGFPILCYSHREDPRDVLVLPEGTDTVDSSKPVGTSSLRRVLQLKMLHPAWKTESVRGNVQTRLRKLDEGQYSALIMAAAGLKRLGLEKRISAYFSTEEMIPSAGQGILAVQGRSDFPASVFERSVAETENSEKVESAMWKYGFADRASALAALAERAYVRYLNGGCSSPIAAHAVCDGSTLIIRGFYFDETQRIACIGALTGDMAEPEDTGKRLAEKLKRGDGRKVDCADFEIWSVS